MEKKYLIGFECDSGIDDWQPLDPSEDPPLDGEPLHDERFGHHNRVQADLNCFGRWRYLQQQINK